MLVHLVILLIQDVLHSLDCHVVRQVWRQVDGQLLFVDHEAPHLLSGVTASPHGNSFVTLITTCLCPIRHTLHQV